MRTAHRLSTALVAVITAMAVSSALGDEVPTSEQTDTAAVVFGSQTQSVGKLDLRVGDLTYVLTPEQLQQALGTDFERLSGLESPADEQMDQIEVRAIREQHDASATPIPFGFGSIAWAFQNPADAWRIFFPVELGS
jgi:hypothetical protein